MANVGMGILGGLAGLVKALERINQQNRAEQLQLLQIGAQDPNYRLAPATAAQMRPAGLGQRLLGGTIYQPTPEGQPVIGFGGGALTLQPVAPEAQQIITPERLKALGLTDDMLATPELQAFIGQPLDANTFKLLLGTLGNVRTRAQQQAVQQSFAGGGVESQAAAPSGAVQPQAAAPSGAAPAISQRIQVINRRIAQLDHAIAGNRGNPAAKDAIAQAVQERNSLLREKNDLVQEHQQATTLTTDEAITMAVGGDPIKFLQMKQSMAKASRPETHTNIYMNKDDPIWGKAPGVNVWVHDPTTGQTKTMIDPITGGVVPISVPPPGTKEWRERQEAAEGKVQGAAQARRAMEVVLSNTSEILNIVTENAQSLPATGTVATLFSGLGETTPGRVRNLLEPIKALVDLRTLNEMRKSSGTGASGLGQVTEAEHALLQSVLGSLEQNQKKEDLAFNLMRVHDVFVDIVYGVGNGPPRMLEKFDPANPGRQRYEAYKRILVETQQRSRANVQRQQGTQQPAQPAQPPKPAAPQQIPTPAPDLSTLSNDDLFTAPGAPPPAPAPRRLHQRELLRPFGTP